MILDSFIDLEVKSSVIISKLKKIGIVCKIGDVVKIDINNLWKGSNIEINVKCDVCNNVKNLQFNLYNKNIKKYNIYTCSNKCSSIKNKLTSKERYGDENYVNISKAKKTKLERYGDENYINTSKIKETKLERYGDENYNNPDKTKKTNLEKYGFTCSLQSDIVKKKSKITNLEKYGVEDSRKSEYVKNKRCKTFISNYGVESYMDTVEFREKSKETSIERYGVESPNKSEYIKAKKVKSMLEKYGYISNSMTEESKRKLKETNLKKYGVEYPMQLLEFFNKQQRSSKKIIKYNDNIYYQGSYEKDFLDHLNKIGILNSIKRAPTIDFIYEGKNKKYFPDFYLERLNMIIEVKSSYYYNKYYDKNISKMNRCIELGYNFLFIINKNYKVFNEILSFH